MKFSSLQIRITDKKNVILSNQTDHCTKSSSFLRAKRAWGGSMELSLGKGGLVTTMQISFGPAQFFTHGRLRH